MVLIRLTGPSPSPADRTQQPEYLVPTLATDVIWANAVPDDRLEYVHARAGPHAGTIDLALFHRADPRRAPSGAMALALCNRAIVNSPSLRAWTARPLPPPDFRAGAHP